MYIQSYSDGVYAICKSEVVMFSFSPFPLSSPTVSSTLRNLSNVYREQGQVDKANELDQLIKQKVYTLFVVHVLPSTFTVVRYKYMLAVVHHFECLVYGATARIHYQCSTGVGQDSAGSGVPTPLRGGDICREQSRLCHQGYQESTGAS